MQSIPRLGEFRCVLVCAYKIASLLSYDVFSKGSFYKTTGIHFLTMC